MRVYSWSPVFFFTSFISIFASKKCVTCSEDAPRTGGRNFNLNKSTLENAALNKMFHLDERAPSFIFK